MGKGHSRLHFYFNKKVKEREKKFKVREGEGFQGKIP